MPIQQYRTLLIIFACILAIAAGYAIPRAMGGTPGFYVWKWLSGKANGGRYAARNSVQIYFETYGSGEPVLVLHGGLGCLERMHHQIRALAEKYLVIAVDTRGHGRSSGAEEPFSYALLADDMLAVLDTLKIARVSIVGWSDGGIMALDLAMRYPDRVRKLVAIGANYDVDGVVVKPAPHPEVPPSRGVCARVSRDPHHWPVLYQKVTDMWRTQPHYSIEDLGKIKSPTLIMAGEFDVISRSHTHQLAKAIPQSQEIIIEAGAHSVSDQNASAINSYILNFLRDNVEEESPRTSD